MQYLCSDFTLKCFTMQMPKFSTAPNTFYADLKKRINAYFDQSGKEMTGNFGLYLKAGVLAVGFVGLYISLVFFTPPVLIALLECMTGVTVVSARAN
jgi:linoleoyl-CoA desaturase